MLRVTSLCNAIATLTIIAIVLAGLGSVQAARGRLAVNAGAYWTAWSFRVDKSAAASAYAELTAWPFIAGIATASVATTGAQAAGLGEWPRAIAALMLGVGAGELFVLGTGRKAGNSEGSSRPAKGSLVRRQDERLDRLAHEGIDNWLSRLGPIGLESVARDALKRHVDGYVVDDLSVGGGAGTTDAVKATFVKWRDAFREKPEDQDTRDEFQGLTLQFIKRQRFVYSRDQRRRVEALD